MRKKVLTIMAMLLTTVGAAWADSKQLLVVSLIDGSRIELALADTPHLSFPEDRITIQSSQLQTEFMRYRVADIHFEGAVDLGVPQPKSNSKQVRLDYTRPDEVVVYGNLQGKAARLYTIGGTLLRTLTGTDSGEVHIGTVGLQPGTYVVNIQDVSSFKISVR